MSLNVGPRVMAAILPLMMPLVLLIVISQMLVTAFARSVSRSADLPGPVAAAAGDSFGALSVMPVTPQLWMYALPLIGQQLTMMQLLRGEAVAALPPLLCALVTVLAAIAAFLLARRVYDSERLAVNA